MAGRKIGIIRGLEVISPLISNWRFQISNLRI
jgi:hypothetical protein